MKEVVSGSTSTSTLEVMAPAEAEAEANLSKAITKEIISKTGKVTGHSTVFSDLSASELRKSLKASGFKGRELTDKINETLTGGADSRCIIGMAWMQNAINKGYLPDQGALRKGTGVLKFVKQVEPKVKASTVIKDATRLSRVDKEKLLVELQKALGLTEEAIDIAADAASEEAPASAVQ